MAKVSNHKKLDQLLAGYSQKLHTMEMDMNSLSIGTIEEMMSKANHLKGMLSAIHLELTLQYENDCRLRSEAMFP